MNLDEPGAVAVEGAAVRTVAAVRSRRSWAVVNMDSQYQNTVLVTRWRWYAAWWAASLRIFDGNDMKIVRTSVPHDVPVSTSTPAAVRSRRSWAVVNMDSQYQNTVLVTRWRWYAAWWAASLRIFDGNDMRIVRTGPTLRPRT